MLAARTAAGRASNVTALDQALLRQLCLTRPDEFVSARNALAKQLRAGGDRDGATALTILRRPSWIDWALNTAAAERAAVADEFAGAAAAMRKAQHAALEGRGGVDLRAAISGLRDQSAELTQAAAAVLTANGRASSIAELTERLTQVAADEAATDRLRAGVLLDADADGDELFAGIELPDRPPPAEAAKRAAKPATTSAPKRAASASQSSKRADAERVAERRALEAERKQADRDLRAATRDLDRADSTVRKAQAELSKAEAAVERARHQLAEADAERDALQRRAADAEAVLERTGRALDADR